MYKICKTKLDRLIIFVKHKTERVHIRRKNIKIKNENKKEKKMTKCTHFLRDGCKWKRI